MGVDAFDEIFEVLELEKAMIYSGFFMFSGDYEQALQAIHIYETRNWWYCNFQKRKIDQFLHQIDIENIVLETDSPYLAPAPFVGTNESSYVT